ncbi:hypothetical protein [Luteimonas kalidii]|uniref:Tetratricopeptide repeat protein n=1 Tax=Luteimonas kalidii TaxID=3042025 RepID=A0ABT6JQS9_9GAMM|nr:hypothetical protein [Luteimonas kalidii]MDH5833043.1 hypothetical protein [Luteimonas kalidii]
MPSSQVRFLIASLLVAVIVGLLFVPGLPGQFFFDDIPNIVNNTAIRLTRLDAEGVANLLATQQASGLTRTLPALSFALDYWRGGGADPMVFRITSIGIHALTTFVLAWFFRSVLLAAGVAEGRVRWLAPALALAWAVHPLQVSSVLYVVQRFQTMGTFFLVLALWAYLDARQRQVRGESGRMGLLLTALLWVLALGCKEDSALLPAYALALELTVLRFAAADPRLVQSLRRSYLLGTVAASAVFLFLVLPHYWQWEAYPGRDFSSIERLLTQPRVLCMYLWQILLPLPRHMPFFYDWVEPSRSLLQPWTTLPAIALVLGLLGLAWMLRKRLPLFALGVFLFFSSHAIASNVVGLELVFEHRNHFGLIGIVLALGSLLERLGPARVARILPGTACAVALLAMAGATVARAQSWRSTASIAEAATLAAPASGRAWVELCASHFRAGGGATPANTRLDEAIDACTRGAEQAPGSLNSLTLLMVLKSLRGDARSDDWQRLQSRMRTVRMTHDNVRVFTILLAHWRLGVALDREPLIDTLDILLHRATFGPQNLANLGYFVMHDLSAPDRAMPYLLRTIEVAPANDPIGFEIAAALRARGRPDLAGRVEAAAGEGLMHAQ